MKKKDKNNYKKIKRVEKNNNNHDIQITTLNFVAFFLIWFYCYLLLLRFYLIKLQIYCLIILLKHKFGIITYNKKCMSLKNCSSMQLTILLVGPHTLFSFLIYLFIFNFHNMEFQTQKGLHRKWENFEQFGQ